MGALERKMPVTYWTFLLGTLALCGVPPFSGFFSKDEILAAASGQHHVGLFLLATFVAMLTTFYMFRLWFVAFQGPARSEAAEHAHESPKVMTWPLVLLAFPTVLAAFWGIKSFIDRQFSPGQEEAHSTWTQTLLAPFGHAPLAAMAGLAAVLFGFSFAMALYRNAAHDPLPDRLGFLARAMRNRFYLDEIYEKLMALTHEALARLADWIDRWLIAGLAVRGVSGTTEILGRALRLVQTGNLQTYALLSVLGVAIVLYLFLAR